MTFDPSMHYTLVWGSFAKFGGHRVFLKNLTSGWPLHDLWPSNELYFDQGFFLQNLVAIQHFSAIWPLLDPGWPLHDFWPQQCITLWSGVLSTKFGGHRALLNKLTPTWPQLTPTWPLIPVMHYGLVRDSSHQIWWPMAIGHF